MNSILHTNRRRWTRRSPSDPSLAFLYALLAGPLGLLAVFCYVPAFSAVYHAFTEWDVGAESTWIGLDNFRRLATDDVFIKSLSNILKLGAFSFAVSLTIPFVVAEMIFHLKSERWRYLCRVAIVMPMVVPGVVVFMLWRYIYSDAGIVSELMHAVGLDDWVYGWLSHPKTAIWAVACVGFPFAHGFHTLVYYAGLANIPSSVLEAAELDGLSVMGRIARIHIPLITPQVKLLVIITVIGVVNSFESIYILTQDGGPGFETMVPGLHMYLNGFAYQRMGYACAIGLVILVFLLAFTISLNRILPTNPYERKGNGQ